MLQMLEEPKDTAPAELMNCMREAQSLATDLEERDLSRSISYWMKRGGKFLETVQVDEESDTKIETLAAQILPVIAGVDVKMLKNDMAAYKARLATKRGLARKAQSSRGGRQVPPGIEDGYIPRARNPGHRRHYPRAVPPSPPFRHQQALAPPSPNPQFHAGQPSIPQPTLPAQHARGRSGQPVPRQGTPLCRSCQRAGRPADHQYIWCEHTTCDRCGLNGHIAAYCMHH